MLNPTLRAQLDGLRAGLDPHRVPGGIAQWWPCLSAPDGAEDISVLEQHEWQQFYGYLETGNARPGQVPPLSQFQAALNDWVMDGVVPLAVAHFEAGVLEADFRAAVTRAASAQCGLESPPGDPNACLRARRVVMLCCPLHDQWDRAVPVYRGRVARFKLDSGFWFSGYDCDRPPYVHVDPGDGLGERRLRFGEELICTYPAGGGRRQVSLRFDVKGQAVKACAWLHQSDVPAPPAARSVWPLATGPVPLGRAWIHESSAVVKTRSLAILIEGFPGGYAHGYLYEMFNQHGTLDTFRARGYDVALLGFANGMASIEVNAKAVEALIAKAQAEGYTDLVVGAVSMGGLVARYALTSLEASGREHSTRVFFTVDTPHRGAYTSLAIQWFVHYFAPAIPLMRSFAALLDCPANQQFVALWLDGDAVISSPLRETFKRELAAMGNYPSRPLRLALACGRGDGVRGMAPGATIMRWHGSPFAGAELRALPVPSTAAGPIAQGHGYLSAADAAASLAYGADASYEGVPGGYNNYPYIAAFAAMGLGMGKVEPLQPFGTSIPTVSALDIDQDPSAPIPAPGDGCSPFHNYLCAEQNMPHVKMTPAMSAWLLDKVGWPPFRGRH